MSVSRDLLFLLAFVPPLIFWFWTVPLLEFVQGPLWFLASAAAALGFVRLRESLSRTRWIENGALGLVYLTITAAALVGFGVSADVNQEFRIPDVPKANYTEMQTDSGLVIHAIEGDQRAFLAPLPNTPRSQFQPDLSLRHAGDLGSGFVINSP